jgi:hypothetical protein
VYAILKMTIQHVRFKGNLLSLVSTVKASNFGPHGNIGLFLASSVASVDESCANIEPNRICRSEGFLQLLFSSFFCRTLPMIASPSEKEVQS